MCRRSAESMAIPIPRSPAWHFRLTGSASTSARSVARPGTACATSVPGLPDDSRPLGVVFEVSGPFGRGAPGAAHLLNSPRDLPDSAVPRWWAWAVRSRSRPSSVQWCCGSGASNPFVGLADSATPRMICSSSGATGAPPKRAAPRGVKSRL